MNKYRRRNGVVIWRCFFILLNALDVRKRGNDDRSTSRLSLAPGEYKSIIILLLGAIPGVFPRFRSRARENMR